MTQNQINYQKNVETKRSNLEQERQGRQQLSETNRHNVATEQLNERSLSETVRHNTATESEANRHNVATEGETQRSNLANELLKSAQLQEQQRHNVADEYNTRYVANTSAAASMYSADRRAQSTIGSATINAMQSDRNSVRDSLTRTFIALSDQNARISMNNANIQQREAQSKRETTQKYVQSAIQGATSVYGDTLGAIKSIIPLAGLIGG